MKEYEPNKLRSRPFRFITLPILVTFLFIFYWFMLTPLLYVLVLHKFDGDFTYRCTYWAILLAVFLLLLAALIAIWRCKRKHRNESVVNRQAEFSTLLRESKYDFDKNCDLQGYVKHREDVADDEKCDMKEEGFCARESFNSESLRKRDEDFNHESRDIVDEFKRKTLFHEDGSENSKRIPDAGGNTIDKNTKRKTNIKFDEDNIGKLATKRQSVVYEIKKEKANIKEVCDKQKSTDKLNLPDDGMKDTREVQVDVIEKLDLVEEINNDKNFPRRTLSDTKPNIVDETFKCDTEKVKMRRPKTLHIETNIVETDRKQIKSLSPLTPREIFFRDLIENANKQRNSMIENFLENERKCSEMPCRKSGGSAEYFIMNVGPRVSCTAEAFIFVDEQKSEPVLEIRSDCDDVFLD